MAGTSFTENLSRSSATHPWLVIAAWVVTLVIAIVLIASLLGGALTTQFIFTNTPESQRGLDLIEDLRGFPNSTNEVVIVRSDSLTVDDPAFQSAVESVTAGLRELGPMLSETGRY